MCLFSLAVLDSSVIVKWFRQEEVLAEGRLSLRLACLVGRRHVAAPELLICEVENVPCHRTELSAEEILEAVWSLFSFPPEITALSETWQAERWRSRGSVTELSAV